MKSTITSLVLGLSGFIALAGEAPQSTPAKDPELQSELLRRTATDQEARKAMTQWMKDRGRKGVVVPAALSKEEKAEFERLTAKVKGVDEENMKWLRGVVEKHGWPTSTLVGQDGANAAWLLVQHSDVNPKFQRRCLDLMAKLPKDEVPQSNVAYLTDRVLLAEGKKQRYGTQFRLVDGKWKPRPLEDEKNVDKRREEVGLPPLAEYAKLIEQQYGGNPKK
jgi:Family of unknown function (DUF6624)